LALLEFVVADSGSFKEFISNQRCLLLQANSSEVKW